LESDFPEITFRKTNTAKRENNFLEIKSNFFLTGKYFSLIIFSNGKQIQESLENNFLKITLRKTNIVIEKIAFNNSWSCRSCITPLLRVVLLYIYNWEIQLLWRLQYRHGDWILAPYSILFFYSSYSPQFHSNIPWQLSQEYIDRSFWILTNYRD
jgi:hypothetical protein